MLAMTDTTAQARKRMVKWLTACAVGSDGVVWSWINPGHPGYAYPEIAGYLLCFLAEEDSSCCLQRQIARRLCDNLAQSGAVGRNGLLYLFDTAMALTGLVAHAETCELKAQERIIVQRAFQVLTYRIHERNAVWSNSGSNLFEHRWSTEFGPHLLKLSVLLQRANDQLGWAERFELFHRLLEDLLPRFKDGRFRAFGDTPVCNLHAHCYALEGLLAADSGDEDGFELRSYLLAGADWLADVQNECGGLPEWHDGRRGSGLARADVAAQALRLWLLLDRSRYRDQIDRCLVFLVSLQDATGGLRFTSASGDVNTWATIFATQALGFLHGRHSSYII